MPTAAQNNMADLGFQLFAPSRVLRPYLQSYWSLRRETPLPIFREEYMHPRGGFGIVFNFGDPVYLDGRIVNEPVFLDGANMSSRKMGFSGQIELLGVRFQEGGAYPFLGVPLHELRNELRLLDVLDRRHLLQLYGRLRETAVLPAQVHLLDQWLIKRLGLGKERSVLIPSSLAQLRAHDGQLPIPELAQQLAVSQRQLERLFRLQVGITPKQYARLVRVETARLALKQLHRQTTTSLAVDLGFFDQAHFIREFRAVVGMTPFAYKKRARSRAD